MSEPYPRLQHHPPVERPEGAALFDLVELPLRLNRQRLLLLFAAGNLGFLALDVAIAHSGNQFVPVYEWIPILAAPPAALSTLLLALRRRRSRALYVVNGLLLLLNVVVGLLGTAFHALAALPPTVQFQWAWVLFSAPELAPLSFTGVALVGLVAATVEEPPGSGVLGYGDLLRLRTPLTQQQHLLWLLGLGFLGAALTSFLDHGQYGYDPFEWIPVVTGIFAAAVAVGSALVGDDDARDATTYFWTMLVCIAVGVLGFGFHLSRDLGDTGVATLERMRAFAPIFAPFLFSDLGVLGLLLALRLQPGSAQRPELRTSGNTTA